MKRRDFIAFAGATATALALPRFAFAQAAKVPRVVFLSTITGSQLGDFLRGLTSLGWVDGKNITVDVRVAPTANDMPALAEQAVASKPDVILANGRPAAPAAKAATSTIPIVFTNVAVDPVSIGLVSSLTHPGGNATGNFNPEPAGKKLQYLKQIVPDLKRFGYLRVPEEEGGFLAPVQAAALALGLEPVVIDFANGPDFATQFDRVVAADVQGVYTPPGLYLVSKNAPEIDLLLKNKLRGVVGGGGPFVPGGPAYPGVVIYGADVHAQIERSASFVDAILKGAKPSDLPVEAPTVYKLALNLDMAKKIGLTIPPSMLAEVTDIIDWDIRAPAAVAK